MGAKLKEATSSAIDTAKAQAAAAAAKTTEEDEAFKKTLINDLKSVIRAATANSDPTASTQHDRAVGAALTQVMMHQVREIEAFEHLCRVR